MVNLLFENEFIIVVTLVVRGESFVVIVNKRNFFDKNSTYNEVVGKYYLANLSLDVEKGSFIYEEIKEWFYEKDK